MSWKDIVKRDFPSEKYALLVKVLDDYNRRKGKKSNAVDHLEYAKQVYDDRPSGKPMTDDEFVRAWIKNELYGLDRKKEFSVDDEKYAFDLQRVLGEIWRRNYNELGRHSEKWKN